jgi:L-fuculose-phosphate aldolase
MPTDVSNPDDLRRQIGYACRVLAAHGAGDLIWGHVSARHPSGEGIWLKQAGWGLEEITPERVHHVSHDGEVLAGGGQRHVEYPIHTEILAARPDVGAVVHIHPRHSVALAASGQTLRPVSHEANLFGPEPVPRFTDTSDLIVTAELGKRLADVLGSASAAFLVNHGVVCVGPDVATATVTAVLLERACEVQLLTLAAGGWPTWSDDAESEAKRLRIYSPAALQQAWDYLVRTLPPVPPSAAP